MITVPAPQNINGDQLAAELQADGYTDVHVTLVGDHLEVRALTESGYEVGEQSRSKIEQVVAAHVPKPVGANADEALRDALLNFPTNGTPKQLADLLAGKSASVRVPGRPV